MGGKENERGQGNGGDEVLKMKRKGESGRNLNSVCIIW